MKPADRKPNLRCPIYTRVSTEHGLEQEFNSLDNQREASEATRSPSRSSPAGGLLRPPPTARGTTCWSRSGLTARFAPAKQILTV
jgi:hypothetical protein